MPVCIRGYNTARIGVVILHVVKDFVFFLDGKKCGSALEH